MFDLFRSRDKMVKILLGVLLSVVALSMVAYLVPSYGDPLLTTDPVLAEVGSFRITASQALQQFQANPQAQQLPPELISAYFPQFLDNYISQRAAVYQAERMGIRIPDEEVIVGLQANFPEYFQDGKLISAEQFELALNSIGMTSQIAVDTIRNQLLLVKLQDVMLENAIVTPQEVEEAFRGKYERATIDYIAFDSAEMRDRVNITDAQARAQFENTKALYNEPAKNTFRVAVLDQFQMESAIQVSEQELRDYYNSTLDNFRVDERIAVRHILVADEDKAEDLKSQLDNGADFVELARANSEDGGTAESGGDLGFIARGSMDTSFEDVAFALPAGEISDVVQTTFGYHIIEVTEREPSRILPFEEVRGVIESDARAQIIGQRMEQAAEQIRQGLTNTPANAAQIAGQNGAQLIQITEAAAGDPIPTLGVSPEIDSALSQLEPGGVSPVLALPADRLVVAILDSRIEGRPSTFEEVEAEVRDRMLTDLAAEAATDAAEEAAMRVRAGESLAAVARDMNVELHNSGNFSRVDTIDGLGPAAYMEDAFRMKVGEIIGPELVQNRNVVAMVTSKTEADMTTLDFERDELVLQLKTDKAAQINELWQDSIMTRLTAEGEIVRHQDQIDLLLGQLR